jgi:hypothetical protein
MQSRSSSGGYLSLAKKSWLHELAIELRNAVPKDFDLEYDEAKVNHSHQLLSDVKG